MGRVRDRPRAYPVTRLPVAANERSRWSPRAGGGVQPYGAETRVTAKCVAALRSSGPVRSYCGGRYARGRLARIGSRAVSQVTSADVAGDPDADLAR